MTATFTASDAPSNFLIFCPKIFILLRCFSELAALPYPVETFGGLQGEVRQPTTNDPLPGTINGQARLSETEVRSIISYAADRARTTRAGIRLPIGIRMEVFITVVNNPNQPGVEPTVLGTFRAGEATMFSWDVAVQKARTALYYSSRDLLGFGRNIAMYFRMLAGPELAKRHHNFSRRLSALSQWRTNRRDWHQRRRRRSRRHRWGIWGARFPRARLYSRRSIRLQRCTTTLSEIS